jgi:mycoredoxin
VTDAVRRLPFDGFGKPRLAPPGEDGGKARRPASGEPVTSGPGGAVTPNPPYAVIMSVLDIIAGRPVATPHHEALAHAEHGVTIYWRPGCPYTARLRMAVRAHRDRARWVNIWEDAAGRAFVASVNDGNETVPTVVIDGMPHTNPAPSVVRTALSR